MIGGFVGIVLGVLNSYISFLFIGPVPGSGLGSFMGTSFSAAWCAILGICAGMIRRWYALWLIAGPVFAGQAIGIGYFAWINNGVRLDVAGLGFIFAWNGGLLGLVVAILLRWGRPDIQNPDLKPHCQQ